MKPHLAAVAVLAGAVAFAPGTAPAAQAPSWVIPTVVKKLPNGLTVVVSEDHTTPTFGISVVYKVGFRLEPKGRTGFAHLFEHMMFEGTPDSPKGVFNKVIQGGGGINNGSTRFDYTDYIESAPVSALDPILWLEADRMKALDISVENLNNQRDVVKEEIRVNVKNRPYGLFFWTDLCGLAFDRWENAHDGYGSFTDLDAAKIEDVKAFHTTFYAPNNAVIGIAGDVKPDEVFALVEKYFGAIPSQPLPPKPELSEKLGDKERTLTETDQFARVPAVAIGYRMPEPGSPDYIPAWVLGDLLVSGDASRLYQALVKGKELFLNLDGGVHWPLGNAITNGGPTMMVIFGLYKPVGPGRQMVDAVQQEIDAVASKGVTAAELERVKTKMISDHFSNLEMLINRADTLAIRQALTGDAASINKVPAQIAAVTVSDVKRVAAKYLTVPNRSWIDRLSAPKPQQGAK
ncbi:MAG TPA: pitrilysin family protein [Thermoanaerobaculaceae bacterium]|nr:pitrilysin family protein [Thermoanaerobaculaceae bacterium]